MFIVQLDDIADKKQKYTLLDKLLKIPLNEKIIKSIHLTCNINKEYFIFTWKIWNEIKKQISKYPRYKELNKIFYCDLNQVLNVMRYSYLVNKIPYLINDTEARLFFPYNMAVFLYSDLDLMSSLKINTNTLGLLRKIVWELQLMARIGNWISTWEREIYENDFTSGILFYGINSGIININKLKQEKYKLEVIKKIKDTKIEKEFLKEWEQHYFKIKEFDKKVRVLSIKEFLPRIESLIILHLTSKGYK